MPTRTGMRVTYLDCEPIDLDILEEEIRGMAKVVLVLDIARHYDRDPASFLKLLKRNDIELLFTIDPVSGQERRCVTVETAEDIKRLMESEHEVVKFQ